MDSSAYGRQRHDISNHLPSLLIIVTRCGVGQLANIWIWAHLHHVQFSRQLAFAGCSIFFLLHRADETQPGRNSCPRLHFGFQFGLYHVVVALSVLRSISLAYFICLDNNPVWTPAHTNSVFIHSRKRPAPVADTFPASQGCPLTGVSTVFENDNRCWSKWKLSISALPPAKIYLSIFFKRIAKSVSNQLNADGKLWTWPIRNKAWWKNLTNSW